MTVSLAVSDTTSGGQRIPGIDDGRKRLTTLREMVALALGAAQTRKQDPRSTRG